MRASSFVFLVSIVVTLVASTAWAQQTRPMRVACRMGQPPFNDAPAVTSTTCQGLFAAIFYRMIELSNVSYSMTMIDTGSFDPLLIVNTTTNSSVYDMVITFHTVTPARLLLYDFSLAMFESADAVALQPKYKKDNRDLATSLLRKSVLYVWAVISALAAGMTIVILLFEWKETEGSFMEDMPFWRRLLWAGEMGLETVLTAGTSEDINSQIVRSIRGLVAVSGVAMLAIFGAVISSQLTAASLQKSFTEVSELRGTRLAISSSTLAPYLNSLGITTVLQDDINKFAAEFYGGSREDFDGFVAAEPVVNYLHNANGKADQGFTVSKPFLKSGVPDLKAFPISFALDTTIKRRVSETFSRMRDAGEITSMSANYIAVADGGGSDDIPVPAAGMSAVIAIVAVIFGGMILLTIGLIIYTIFVKKLPLSAATWDAEENDGDGEERTSPRAVPDTNPEGGASSNGATHDGYNGAPANAAPLGNSVVWKGKTLSLEGADPQLVATLAFIAKQAATESDPVDAL